MGDTFSVDTEGIARSLPGFRALTEEVRRAAEHLQGELSSLGECWGDDHGGQQFAEQYLPARNQMADASEQLHAVLASTGDGIETMANGLARDEQHNAETAARLMPAQPPQAEGGPMSPGHRG